MRTSEGKGQKVIVKSKVRRKSEEINKSENHRKVGKKSRRKRKKKVTKVTDEKSKRHSKSQEDKSHVPKKFH